MTRQASNEWDCIHTLLKQHEVVPIGVADEDDQWNTSGIYDDVAFGVGARCPRGISTEEPSMLAGSNQSGHVYAVESAWRDATSARRCWRSRYIDISKSCRCHSPRTGGRSCHGMPMCSTNRMLLRAVSSLMPSLGAPPLADGVNVSRVAVVVATVLCKQVVLA